MKQSNAPSGATSVPYQFSPSEFNPPDSNAPFKTQQEIFAHLASGGKVQHIDFTALINYFKDNGSLNTVETFKEPHRWQPYIEPVKVKEPEFKVYKWEKWIDDGIFGSRLVQSVNLMSEETAATHYPEYTKVPGSERVKPVATEGAIAKTEVSGE